MRPLYYSNIYQHKAKPEFLLLCVTMCYNPMQKTSFKQAFMNPKHIAIIMDGNGRWAKTRGKPRLSGHRAGAESVRRVIKACGKLGIEYLTLYAFSVENWSRPAAEVSGLMVMLHDFLVDNTKELQDNDIRLRVSGRRSDLPARVEKKLREIEELTAGNKKSTLILALSYGGRTEIANAARKLAEAAMAGKIKPSEIDETAVASALYLPDVPDPDLIIRTSGEQRLSNFLTWQSAYSEFYFTKTLWPDFAEADLKAAIIDFSGRARRFGGLPESTEGLSAKPLAEGGSSESQKEVQV